MALIGQIQKNSVLLLIVIGGAMLAFIFTDFMKGGGSDVEFLPTATVYGEEIDEEEYSELRDVYVNREENNALQQGTEFTDQAAQQAEDQAFNEAIRRNLMNREFEKVGLTCTKDELNDMIHGNHIHPWVETIPIFIGADGQFSRDSVRTFINNLEVEPETDEARVQWLEARSQWKAFEEELKDTRKADKYVALIKKGLFVNSLEAKHQYYASNEIRSVRFVIQRYNEIPEDEVSVTDEEIKAYYEEHKSEKMYEMEEARDIDYILIPIKPTKADLEELQTSMEGLKTKFEKTEDNLAFITSNSDLVASTDTVEFSMGTAGISLPENQFFPTGQYPESIDEAVQNSKVGDVIGPFASTTGQNETPVSFIAKITGQRVENQAWVRHILIKVDATRDEQTAKAMSDSIIDVIKANDNFVEMVNAVTEDPGSIATNGEYKWFPEGRMVTEFNDASFNGAIGQLQLVKTTYGYHIVEVLGRAERVVPKMAVVAKNVKPTDNTLKFTEESVYDFIYNVNESEDDSAFWNISADSNYAVYNSRIFINQGYINGVTKPKKVMKFAFGKNALEGDISDPILDGDSYIVAFLSNIIEEGEPKFEDVKEQMRFPALKDKQAQVYIEKMSNKSSLEEVASTITNGTVLNAQITFGANAISGGGGNEPEVIGKLFTKIPEGAMTKPIQGRSGVYVCIVDNITEAPETTDYTQERDYLRTARQGSSDNLVIRALREKADVVDNRRKREYQ